MKRKLLSLGLILLVTIMMLGILFALPVFVRAGTLCVNPGGTDGCYSSIQSAINAAANGDTARVTEGTYLEAITITKSITLAGGWNSDFSARDWDVYVSTIDAQRTGTVIVIPAGITVTVEGFTITGGDASDYLGWGGGIRIGESFNDVGYSIIRHNIITNNIACRLDTCQGEGGGIHVYNNTALIEKNEIVSNTARIAGAGGGKGGGVAMGWSSSVTLFSNLVQSNTAVITPTGAWSGKGGGIYADSSDILLQENYVMSNTAAITGTGFGGGVYLYGDAINNYVSDNVASKHGIGYGGGIYAYYMMDGKYNDITNNRVSDTGTGDGGGVFGYQIGTFANNYIAENTADSGGGMYLEQFSNAEIINNEFRHNQSTDNSGSGYASPGGGAIYSRADNAIIRYNTIISNSAALYGGGIFFTSDKKSTVDHNEISENSAPLGGGIAVYTTTVDINHNTIVSNTATIGGGVFLNGRSQSTLNANTIAHNSAGGFWSAAGGGVAVLVEADVPVTMTNNMVAKNAAGSGGTGAGLTSYNGAMRVLNNTFVDNNTGVNQEGMSLSDTGGTYADEIWNNIVVGHATGILINSGAPFIVKSNFWNNATNVSGSSDPFEIVADPLFVDRAGEDYHLQSTSPIIDQGSDNWTKVDFDGDTRTHGVHDDIGADEWYAGDSYVSANTGNDTTGDGSSGTPFATITKAISETAVGGTVYVGRGTYAECIGVPHSLILRGGYNESASWSRDIAANETTIDGYDTCAVVTVSNFDTDMTLEGFTITRGYSGWGAGVNVSDASVHIISNTIRHNHATVFGAGAIIYPSPYRQSEILNNFIFDNVSDGVFTPRADEIPAPARANGGLINGALVASDGQMTIVNNVIFSNTVSNSVGSGLAVTGYSSLPISVFHNTIANNGSGTGVVAFGDTVDFYNNIVVGFSVGITEVGTAINRDYNAWDNTVNFEGNLTAGAHDILGAVNFVDSANGDFHILPGRVAGAGTDMGITTDMDGDTRPLPAGTAPDIGADEILQRNVYLPLVLK